MDTSSLQTSDVTAQTTPSYNGSKSLKTVQQSYTNETSYNAIDALLEKE